MIDLYQREECSACERVRKQLSRLGLSFRAVNVSRIGDLRAEVLALAGVERPEVPVLVDGDRVIQGSDEIQAYLAGAYGQGQWGEPSYGLTRRLTGYGFGDAVAATRTALAGEGFGVLTEIDVKATMKKKLDVDLPNYLILGACNPPLAHQALTAEPAVGLLLPCNVVVAEQPDGAVVVSAIDPRALFSLVERPEVEPLAREVKQKLARALARI